MADLVERLRATRRTTQFDRAGRLIEFDARPTDLECEAAGEIERLRRLLDHPAIKPTGINWRQADNNETQAYC